MNTEESERRAQLAALTLARTREELRATMASPEPDPNRFPRSATFRWLSNHLTPRTLAMTALTAALARVPFGRLISAVVFARKR